MSILYLAYLYVYYYYSITYSSLFAKKSSVDTELKASPCLLAESTKDQEDEDGYHNESEATTATSTSQTSEAISKSNKHIEYDTNKWSLLS